MNQRVRPEGGHGGLVHLHERAARGRELPKDRIRRVGGHGQVVIGRIGRDVGDRGASRAPRTEDRCLDRAIGERRRRVPAFDDRAELVVPPQSAIDQQLEPGRLLGADGCGDQVTRWGIVGQRRSRKPAEQRREHVPGLAGRRWRARAGHG